MEGNIYSVEKMCEQMDTLLLKDLKVSTWHNMCLQKQQFKFFQFDKIEDRTDDIKEQIK